HFYVFNQNRELVYTGRAIDFPRDYTQLKVDDLDRTLTELSEEKEISQPVINPIGCNVKWKNRDKHWMPADACDLVY
ncbi:MAG: thioredoxin family protein, partial [Bacteroidota bacterium]|nr:thioredoxin family protein [Bacteroidota bacterium]